jgi:hypothetical protein
MTARCALQMVSFSFPFSTTRQPTLFRGIGTVLPWVSLMGLRSGTQPMVEKACAAAAAAWVAATLLLCAWLFRTRSQHRVAESAHVKVRALVHVMLLPRRRVTASLCVC